MGNFEDIHVDVLGECEFDSPFLKKGRLSFVDNSNSILMQTHREEVTEENLQFLELAGPRKKNYFDKSIACGIVTCGGLCPGINDVIRGIVVELYEQYGVRKVLGFRYGFQGLRSNVDFLPIDLNPKNVDDIHTRGGTILSSSRGFPPLEEVVESLIKYNIKILFTIGGDGTIRGASDIAQYIKDKGLDIAVIAIPKTIDNDIAYIDKSFGFETAVQETAHIIESAHEEAKGAFNGIGLIKIMGREAGFIAGYSTLANINVNFCLIPEKKINMLNFLEILKKRLNKKQHAVILVSEGFGQDLLSQENQELDASGNIKLKDIGHYLKDEIEKYFDSIKVETNIKYFNPSYSIRSVPANAMDSAYCLILAQSAVHAGMAGKTNMLVSLVNDHYVYLPINMIRNKKKRVNPLGRLWYTVMDSTLQPKEIFK
ncbi:MAG: ATP-dependent 6-phosphofructokinase [bacterium]|nr:ATP-dependent 6-phosphofructokinase [bacterium]